MGKITITHFGEEPPRIECFGVSDVEIVVIDGLEAAQLFMEHAEVKVYIVWSSRHQDMLSESHFSVFRGCEDDSDNVFHIDDLPEIPASEVPKYKHLEGDKAVIAYAIDQGVIDETGFNEPITEPS